MRTVVVSDLHLGGSIGVDVLRNEGVRNRMKQVVAGCDRLVMLGDTLELRHGPAYPVLEAALPVLNDIASALDPGTEVVIVPGNHDHALVAPWLDARRRDGRPDALKIDEFVPVSSGDLIGKVAEAMKPAEVLLAMPGVRLRDDVYAFHGNYLDRHITVPTFERLSAGLMAHVTGRKPDQVAGVDDYEAVLGPMYAWSYAVAQQAGERAGKGAHGFSSRVWQMLAGGDGHRPIRRKAAELGFAGAVGALNALRVGPLSSNISPARLRTAGIEAAVAAAEGIGVSGGHLIYGHTHRPGPLVGDDVSEWASANGMRLWNTGSWVFEQHFLSKAPPGSAYWPGRSIEVLSEGDPKVVSTMNDLSAHEILGAMNPADD